MRSDLRSLRERIRQVEAGGHRDTPLRRVYNHKLRAHRTLRGGGGLQNEAELEQKKAKLGQKYTSRQFTILHQMFSTLQNEVSTLNEKVSTLDEKVTFLMEHLDEGVNRCGWREEN